MDGVACSLHYDIRFMWASIFVVYLGSHFLCRQPEFEDKLFTVNANNTQLDKSDNSIQIIQ